MLSTSLQENLSRFEADFDGERPILFYGACVSQDWMQLFSAWRGWLTNKSLPKAC